ncbi:beta-galactosidase [Caenimonas terrae]|uniref:Beta-galactosidase n=1 Tax=Caenimonas terrae TaxID=696074 RepID=A0ABW0NDL4_9BURK
MNFRLQAGLALSAAALVASVAAAPALPQARRPLVIAPVIEGLLICDARPDNEYRNLIDARSQCAAHNNNAVEAAASLLDALEPGGPRGAVQVGYTVTVQLLSLYRKREGRWAIDEARIKRVMDVLNALKRPAVLYLAANHFDTSGEITSFLESDPANLMHLADGSVPGSAYFGYKIVPYTLQTDESIPVNRLRFDALRRVAASVVALPKATRDRLVAITLAGEVHHMFPNFEGGMGNFEQLSVTDYSPASVAGFRRWLRNAYRSVDALNQATGARYGSFEEVQPPARSMLAAHANALQHFDGAADGWLAVSGWLWDPKHRIAGLELYVDGQSVAQVPGDFNRLDVYRTLDAVDDPSVGFRHDLDFSSWAPGEYALQVVARTAAGNQELGHATLQVEAGAPPRPGGEQRHAGRLVRLPALATLSDVRASLDLPKPVQKVMFNRLARDWNGYRAWQVKEFIASMYRVARSAGLPADKLYSHQILPRANSSWNAQFFATDDSVGAALPWKQGINTYGGAAGSTWTQRYIQEMHLTDYGVPEFHQQQWKRPDAAARALALHQRLGARFVSPYYMSVIGDRNQKAGATLNRMEIRPNNSLDGSDQLYRAIQAMAAQ